MILVKSMSPRNSTGGGGGAKDVEGAEGRAASTSLASSAFAAWRMWSAGEGLPLLLPGGILGPRLTSNALQDCSTLWRFSRMYCDTRNIERT